MSYESRLRETEQLLLETCKREGYILAGDQSVCERDAEKLLGFSDFYLKNKRDNEGVALPRRKVGSKWRYRLSDIAKYIENDYQSGIY